MVEWFEGRPWHCLPFSLRYIDIAASGFNFQAVLPNVSSNYCERLLLLLVYWYLLFAAFLSSIFNKTMIRNLSHALRNLVYALLFFSFVVSFPSNIGIHIEARIIHWYCEAVLSNVFIYWGASDWWLWRRGRHVAIAIQFIFIYVQT
jgi:hypothetical protein